MPSHLPEALVDECRPTECMDGKWVKRWWINKMEICKIPTIFRQCPGHFLWITLLIFLNRHGRWYLISEKAELQRHSPTCSMLNTDYSCIAPKQVYLMSVIAVLPPQPLHFSILIIFHLFRIQTKVFKVLNTCYFFISLMSLWVFKHRQLEYLGQVLY
jgi:hypothetical protein